LMMKVRFVVNNYELGFIKMKIGGQNYKWILIKVKYVVNNYIVTL
jgi:hypothetical protein